MHDGVNIFYTTVSSFLNSFVPLYYPSVSDKPHWFRKELTHPSNKKFRLGNTKTPVLNVYSRYLSARSSFTVINSLWFKNDFNRCKV